MAVEVGSRLKGKVSGITKFGAFVDLPEGKVGLVHISEVAEKYVNDITQFVAIGDEVEVMVIKVEIEGKIALSMRKAKYNVDSANEAKPKSYGNDDRSSIKRRIPDFKESSYVQEETFDQKMSRFLKDSEDRLATIRRNTETKRGGRGSRRG